MTIREITHEMGGPHKVADMLLPLDDGTYATEAQITMWGQRDRVAKKWRERWDFLLFQRKKVA